MAVKSDVEVDELLKNVIFPHSGVYDFEGEFKRYMKAKEVKKLESEV